MKVALFALGAVLLLTACRAGTTPAKRADSPVSPTVTALRETRRPPAVPSDATLTVVPPSEDVPASQAGDEAVDYEAAAEAAVRSALLTIEDLPLGWSSQPQDEENDLNPKFTGECAAYNREGFLDEVASADSDELTGPDGELLFTSAAAFADEAGASAAFAEFAELSETCEQQLEVALTGSVEAALMERGWTPNSGTVAVAVSSLSFVPIGDELSAYRVGVAVDGAAISMEYTMDFIAWRHGKMIGGIVYMAFPMPSAGEEERLCQLVQAKLAAAQGTLPG